MPTFDDNEHTLTAVLVCAKCLTYKLIVTFEHRYFCQDCEIEIEMPKLSEVAPNHVH